MKILPNMNFYHRTAITILTCAIVFILSVQIVSTEDKLLKERKIVPTAKEDANPENTPPDKEKRFCITDADGFAENTGTADCHSAAIADAEKQAENMARTYIRSKINTEDFILKPENIRILEQKDMGTANSRCHVRIKAEAEYILNSPISDYRLCKRFAARRCENRISRSGLAGL